MLHDVHEQGIKDAFAHFGIKEAWFEGTKNWLRGIRANPVGALKDVGHSLVGHPIELPKQLLSGTAFKPEGLLNLRKNFWPAGWGSRIMGLGFPAYGVVQALRGKGDPNEGVLSNTLSALGSGAGFTLGYPALGMLGMPFAAEAGHNLGRGLGRMLGSKPSQPTQPMQPMQPMQQAYHQQPMPDDLYNPGGYQ